MAFVSELLQDPEFWVGAALLVFVAILVRVGVPGMAARALDGQARKIKDQLDEAARLRSEAEALLASIKLEREEAERTAARIVADAQAQAERINADARIKLQEQIRRRSELAERKIAQAEAQATAQVRAAAVDLAANVAETVLAGRLRGKRSDPLIDRGIEQMAQKLG